MEPLISCIMPTYNRRAFVPHAIRYFLRQDYPHKELIILDDGEDCIQDLIPDHPLIRYERLPGKLTLGTKMNMACSMAKGNIIANWDDDDWYAPHRLSYQATAMQVASTYMCGINRLLYLDLQSKQTYEYIYPANQRIWLLGSSLCFRKDYWQKNPFAEINVGMDGLFVWSTTREHVQVMEDHTFSVHMIHPNNVSPKRTDTGWWYPRKPEQIKGIMGEDWELYSRNGSHPLPDRELQQGYAITRKKNEKRKVPNIYACLVHESKECITDLVNNLLYHDPDSVVLLYNGGTAVTLNLLDFSRLPGTVICYPQPIPMQWGYLHTFALHCMEYALAHFEFTALTIVDSDQLCVQKGYAAFISGFLNRKPGIGLLSSVAGRISPGDKSNPVAIQAYKEMALWQPFLDTFPNGHAAFVHWTFWPSTVFTYDAAKDLVRLFKENALLQEIMQKTKIWATEEVIFPTLVKLLGYEVVQNPCSYEYVKYKTTYTVNQAQQALQKSSVYWMHPVLRKINDPVRKYIREKRETGGESWFPVQNEIITATDRKRFIRRINPIPGWLSEEEADLLIISLMKTIQSAKVQGVVVETGSYHGRATVLMGLILKQYFAERKLVSVDNHDGKLGDAVQGLKQYPPSGKAFEKNIYAAGLREKIQQVPVVTKDLQWQDPVAFLLIDWLHDYANVKADFNAFQHCLQPGACIAFHDYASYFPGVVQFVNELLLQDAYIKMAQAGSLIIIEKIA